MNKNSTLVSYNDPWYFTSSVSLPYQPGKISDSLHTDLFTLCSYSIQTREQTKKNLKTFHVFLYIAITPLREYSQILNYKIILSHKHDTHYTYVVFPLNIA